MILRFENKDIMPTIHDQIGGIVYDNNKILIVGINCESIEFAGGGFLINYKNGGAGISYEDIKQYSKIYTFIDERSNIE